MDRQSGRTTSMLREVLDAESSGRTPLVIVGTQAMVSYAKSLYSHLGGNVKNVRFEVNRAGPWDFHSEQTRGYRPELVFYDHFQPELYWIPERSKNDGEE